ncbi:MAG: hypothetical protein ACKOFW_22170, partial [Planctomycetaceae bacterium]
MKSFKLAFAVVCLALVGCGSSSGPIEAPKNATTKPANFAAGSAEAGGGAPAAGGAQPAGAQGATREATPPPSGPEVLWGMRWQAQPYVQRPRLPRPGL